MRRDLRCLLPTDAGSSPAGAFFSAALDGGQAFDAWVGLLLDVLRGSQTMAGQMGVPLSERRGRGAEQP
jgi:hypothetical protein